MQFLRRAAMAASRDISLSAEKRLQKAYHDHYPRMFHLTPGSVVCTEEDNNRFNRWLADTPLVDR